MVAPTLLQAQRNKDTRTHLAKEINKIIRNEPGINTEGIPGFLVGVIDGSNRYVLSFGTIAPDSEQQLDSLAVFEIGSLTKLFTASLVLNLNAMEKLDIGGRVNTFLPAEARNPLLDHLTLEHLLSHTSGLPLRPAFIGKSERDSNPYAEYRKADLLDFYGTYKPDTASSEVVRYSHINYALLEIIVEIATDQTFKTVLSRYLLQPQGTDRLTGFDIPGVTPGFGRDGSPASVLTLSSFGGSEGLRSCMDDLLSFLRFQLRTHQVSHRTVLFSPYLEKINREPASTLGGWQILGTPGRYDALVHSGHSPGHYAFAGIVPETNTAVVLLTNSSSGIGDLGYLVLRMINNQWKRKAN